MQIPNQFPQFKDKKVLLAVFGNQSGIFYVAQNGILDKIKEIEVENPKYSEKEGFFASGPGGTTVVGSLKEIPKQEIQHSFMRQASQFINDFNKKEIIDEIYLYCAPEIIKEFKEELPNEIQNIIKKETRGTYLRSTPIELLELISTNNQ